MSVIGGRASVVGTHISSSATESCPGEGGRSSSMSSSGRHVLDAHVTMAHGGV
jgi:hypothetical protein